MMDLYQLYMPDEPPVQGVLYLKNSVGDWYENQCRYSSDTLKVIADETNTIIAYSDNVSALWPINCSVVEIDKANVPNELSCDGVWIVDDNNQIVKRELSKSELIMAAEAEKTANRYCTFGRRR